MPQAIWYHIVTVGSLILFKLCVLFVGYLIARLGYDLLLKGVSGAFHFHSQLKGSTADLVSASPGIFFIFMATILIAVGVIKDKPFETIVTMESLQSAGERGTNEPNKPDKPGLPDKPPPAPEKNEDSYTENQNRQKPVSIRPKNSAASNRSIRVGDSTVSKKPILPENPPKEEKR